MPGNEIVFEGSAEDIKVYRDAWGDSRLITPEAMAGMVISLQYMFMKSCRAACCPYCREDVPVMLLTQGDTNFYYHVVAGKHMVCPVGPIWRMMEEISNAHKVVK